MKLLIVEDERELSDSIVNFLNREDYLCEQAFSVSEASTKVNLYEYDCILLDLMLPGGSGLDVLRSKSALAEHLSGDMADMMNDFNFVYAHIKNLKAKLADAGAADCIKTLYGTGYKWEENEKSAE